MRRRKPTAFPTEPLSLPERGSRHLDSKRWWPLSRENGPGSVTSPRTGRPASVASSGTTALGARPQRGKTSARPAHGRSARWGLRAAHCLSSGWGSVATRGLGSRASPATTALKLPKSARQAPTGHSSSRQPPPAPAARASLHSLTRRRAVEWDPPQPRPATSLSKTRLAACRCLRGAARSASSTEPTHASWPASAGLSRGAGTGAEGDRPSMPAYFATVFPLARGLRAISALGAPSAFVDRMSSMVSRGKVISSVLPGRARQSLHPGKP